MYVVEHDERPVYRRGAAGQPEQATDDQGNPVMRADRAGLDTVRDRLREHARVLGGAPPAVFIDYLQILRPVDETGRKSDKQNMDETVSELRRISKTYQVPIVAISSLNRAAYGQPISMESFKESGAIEYSSDVLLGLNPCGLRNGDQKDDLKNNAQVFQGFREAATKDLEAVVLKNRIGKLGSVRLELDALHGLYSETKGEGQGCEDPEDEDDLMARRPIRL